VEPPVGWALAMQAATSPNTEWQGLLEQQQKGLLAGKHGRQEQVSWLCWFAALIKACLMHITVVE